MVLRQGNSGPAVKVLQRGLNKLGQLLLVDGRFGGGTREAVVGARELLAKPGPPEADDALQQAIADFPDPFPPLTAAGVTFIARQEVSDARTYRTKFQVPTLPPFPSGITIGIGYDCRFVAREEFEADWGDLLSPAMIEQMLPALGVIGSDDLQARITGVTVPLGVAMRVFATRSLPKYLDQTRTIYSQVDGDVLNSAQRTALVSLVYNRGTDLIGDRRREMQAIQDLLAAGQIDGVASQFESMTRLWNAASAPGLIRRRRDEATLWRAGFAALQLD